MAVTLELNKLKQWNYICLCVIGEGGIRHWDLLSDTQLWEILKLYFDCALAYHLLSLRVAADKTTATRVISAAPVFICGLQDQDIFSENSIFPNWFVTIFPTGCGTFVFFSSSDLRGLGQWDRKENIKWRNKSFL